MDVRFKWLGTATIILEHEGTELLFDPFLTRSSKVFRPRIEELAAAKSILITHGHFDHIVDVPKILEQGQFTSTVFCTAAPQRALISKGVDERCIQEISPGDTLSIGPFNVQVLKGRHIRFDAKLLLGTLINPRIIRYWSNFIEMFKANRVYKEAHETVLYVLRVADKQILLMGSLSLDDSSDYPRGADLLVLPFQGRSDIARYALPFIDRLQPKRVLLDHHDNTFPPVSSEISTEPFVTLMREEFPTVEVLCPQAGAEWIALD